MEGKMIKWILRNMISIVNKYSFLQNMLKKISMKHPLLTRKLVQVYCNNFPITEKKRERLSAEEIMLLPFEANQIFEVLSRK